MATGEKGRDDLSKHIQELEENVKDLDTRRQELGRELAEIVAAVEGRAQAMAEAALAGKDTKKEYEALTREKTRMDACRQAITLADSKVSALGAEIAESKAELAGLFFDHTADEFRGMLLEYVNRLYSAAAAFDALQEKLDELDEMQRICDIDTNQLPSSDVTESRVIYRRLNAYAEGSVQYSTSRVLETLESKYPALMAQAKRLKN